MKKSILAAFISILLVFAFSWQYQNRFLRARKIVGSVSQIIKPFQSECSRCGRTWSFCESHNTPVEFSTGGSGCFPLCEQCWSELSIQDRIPYYDELFQYWVSLGTNKTLEDREKMIAAVKNGK